MGMGSGSDKVMQKVIKLIIRYRIPKHLKSNILFRVIQKGFLEGSIEQAVHQWSWGGAPRMRTIFLFSYGTHQNTGFCSRTGAGGGVPGAFVPMPSPFFAHQESSPRPTRDESCAKGFAKRLSLYKRTTYNHALPLEEQYNATLVTKTASGPRASN
jgi:hypothetical protein